MLKSPSKERKPKKELFKKSTISGITYTPNEMDPMRLRGGGGIALQFSQAKGKDDANSGRINYQTLQLPGISNSYQVPAKKYDLQSILSGKSDGNLFLSTRDELNLLQIASSKQTLKYDNNNTATQVIINSTDKAFLDNDANPSVIASFKPSTEISSTKNDANIKKYKSHEKETDLSEETKFGGQRLVVHENAIDQPIAPTTKFKTVTLRHHDNATLSTLQNHTETKSLNQSKKLLQNSSANSSKILGQGKLSSTSNENAFKSFRNEKKEGESGSSQNTTKPSKHESKKMHQEIHNNTSKLEKMDKSASGKSNYLNGTKLRTHSRVSNLSQSLGAVLMNLTYISPKLANVSSKLAGALFKLVNISTEEEILAPRLANLLLRMTNISSILDQSASNKTMSTTSMKRTSPELMPRSNKGIKIINLLIKAALSVYKSKKNNIIHHMDKHHQKVLKQFLFTS